MKQNRWLILVIISLAELCALSLWFSASAILPALSDRWNLTAFMKSSITVSVQTGFIVGALLSSIFGAADRFNSRRVFAISALGGAFVNMLLFIVPGPYSGFLVRFLTGMAMAGVYPTAVKMVSNWFPARKGTAIGILIGALTLGSALPHFIAVFFTVDWRMVILASSILALASAALIMVVPDAPHAGKNIPVSFRQLSKVLANKKVMLANGGYFGHMWELYAMWTWLPFFLASLTQRHAPEVGPWVPGIIAFLAIGVAGAGGCLVGGVLADRIGKTKLAIYSMAISGCCAAAISVSYQFSYPLTIALAMVWGMSVIADSAQFSALVAEYSERMYLGTALAFQMAAGFLITILSINLIPLLEKYIGWEWVFSVLAVGPLFGILLMARLARLEKGNLRA